MDDSRGPGRTASREANRPTWWVLLAVSLAIIAVMFARSGSNARLAKGLHGTNSNDPSRQPANNSAFGRKLEQQLAPPGPQSPQSILSGSNTSGEELHVASPPSVAQVPSPTLPVTPTVDSYPGYLEYPENVMSSFPVAPITGEISATASWSTGATLELSISCPPDRRASTGSSETSVSMLTSNSGCIVALKELGITVQPIPFTLTIEKVASQ